MSFVWEAEDLELSRRVAVKIVDDPVLGAELLLREARALASVRHPGLPTVHGVGVHDGWTYLVMERVFGVTLEEHLDRRRAQPLSSEEGVAILGPIAEILAAVHGAGMAHRDLKPGNVMLSPGRTVLLDFGIMLPEVTARDGDRCGTPRYLAPELITGTPAPGQAHLVDTYAFGVMAYEMFAGTPPFVADSLVRTLEHHLSTPAPRLDAVRPDLRRELVELVLSCMAKLPGERPGDMQAVAWELRSLQRQRSEASGPIAIPRSPREVFRRAATNPALELPSNGWEVLVVEDDAENRESLGVALKERGYRARAASDGLDALELIRRTGWRPSVILLDLMMPRMDGYQFLAVQAGDPMLDSIPVVVTTASPSDEVRKFAAVRAVVPKPAALPALLQAVEGVCRRSPSSDG